jgi:hypothetical protein
MASRSLICLRAANESFPKKLNATIQTMDRPRPPGDVFVAIPGL